MAKEATAAKEAEPTDKKKPSMVPLKDLLVLKSQNTSLREQLTEAKTRATTAESRAKIAGARAEDGDDDAIKVVKTELLARDAELSTREQKITEREGALGEREGDLTVTALVASYKSRGLELDEETLKAQDDPSAYASGKFIEHLEEKAKSGGEGDGESGDAVVVESGSHGKAPLDILNMPDDVFEKHYAEQKAAAQAR